MRQDIAFFGGAPLFERALNIVRPLFPDIATFIEPFSAALKSGQVTNNGRWVVEFERRLTEYLGVPSAAFCNGQLALITMLRAAGIAGGEVIVPSFTYAATPHAICWAGATPVFADIAADGSMCLDPADVERKITPRTVAILGVDVYGIACDYGALAEIGRRKGLKVLFDSAPSFGTRVKGRLVGGFGDAQIFSFHATKALATMEGGCLCSQDRELMARAASLRNFGLSGPDECDAAGTNGKMTEICALIGIEQLKTFAQAAATRARIVARMREGLARVPGLSLARAPVDQDPVWLYLPVIVDSSEFGIDRDALAAALACENIHVRKYYSPPCHHLGVYRAAQVEPLPRTEAVAYNVAALPVYNDMTDDECDGIVQAIIEIQRAAPRIARKGA